ncbi:MAG: peptidoglycan DD-metalloendopeptidase family protein [Oscillospiraceae bacterium]
MKQKKVVSIICIILVLVLVGSLLFSTLGPALAVSQSEIDALKNQQSQIAQQRADLKTKMSQIETQKAAIVDQKTALDEQNELARKEIEVINEQIAIYDKLIAQKAEELVEARKVEAKQKEALRVRMRAMEENGSLSYLAIVFEASSFSDLLSRVDFISEIMKYDKNLEDAYIAARENVEKVKAEYEETQAQQQETRKELEAKKADLETQIANAVQLITGLEADLEKYKAEEATNNAREAQIRASIDQKIAELERQQAAGGGTITPSTGQFTWPTPSCTSTGSGFGMRKHPIFGDMRFHSGVDIPASYGATIVASDSGTVVSAVFSSSYGNYVVISHGNGTSTLYAHMSSMAVTSGQSVTKGDTIGYVGSTGWSTGAHLHFEVKIGGALVDPMSQF